ncbi:LysR family transcriptional regulator [Undibacterium sp. Jales W-56]|uniref:LysR family transcriptional regulator n=1 Tax=Undibacterium sp. Jales W-56 TaxID=2897325 RepID=UPI0021D06E46|nr:LysR family transcriptional regulator [Undibacterium sp. Jales W-56]MCU6432277.1 LysR family transcriptional regulator [Undibacterium sp. Jales W-56]
MNLLDLRIFACVARHPSLGTAAQELHLTPSAVSKALRRLEGDLDTVLFDRSARQLVLNASGQRMLDFSQTMLTLADQAKADMMGVRAVIDCRVAAPAILLWRHAPMLAQAMQAYPDGSLSMQTMFEDDALAALLRGEVNHAIVTGEVIEGRGAHWSPDWRATSLGSVRLQLVAGKNHPLALSLQTGPLAKRAHKLSPRSVSQPVLQANSAQILTHDFVSPSRSLFCGERRGSRSDGWRDDQLPRKIRYWMDDLQLLLAMVKSGRALAYLPDFALTDTDLLRIEVSDCAFQCHEQVWLVSNVKNVPRWQQELAEFMRVASTETP